MSTRLTRENCVLIAIDYQEKLVPAMYEKEALIDKSARLIKGFGILGMPVVITEQYPKGLGTTVAEIKEADHYAEIIEKNTFSAWDNEECVEYVRKLNKPNAVVVGIFSISSRCSSKSSTSSVNFRLVSAKALFSFANASILLSISDFNADITSFKNVNTFFSLPFFSLLTCCISFCIKASISHKSFKLMPKSFW